VYLKVFELVDEPKHELLELWRKGRLGYNFFVETIRSPHD
jgi:hypothetical protein